MILVAGPYRSGTNDDPALIQANVRAMTDVALRLFRMGHLSRVERVVCASLIEHAGFKKIGDAIFDEIFHPISRDLVLRCDACLRVGGPPKGADEMVHLALSNQRTVFMSIDEIPVGPVR
jgi:hypothetical protein